MINTIHDGAVVMAIFTIGFFFGYLYKLVMVNYERIKEEERNSIDE